MSQSELLRGGHVGCGCRVKDSRPSLLPAYNFPYHMFSEQYKQMAKPTPSNAQPSGKKRFIRPKDIV